MIALLSDCHANYAALEAVISDAHGAGCDSFIFLGDAVGYHCQPNECISLLQAVNAEAVLGNHDWYLLNGGVCPRSKSVTETLQQNLSVITDRSIQWLKQCRQKLARLHDLYLHGGPEDELEQYIYQVTPNLVPVEYKRLFCGHTHVQHLCELGQRTFCNPGSVGQPRDGNPAAAYAILFNGQIELRRVPYEIERTMFAMRAFGFAPYFYENLRSGSQIGGRIDRIECLKDENDEPQ